MTMENIPPNLSNLQISPTRTLPSTKALPPTAAPIQPQPLDYSDAIKNCERLVNIACDTTNYYHSPLGPEEKNRVLKLQTSTALAAIDAVEASNAASSTKPLDDSSPTASLAPKFPIHWTSHLLYLRGHVQTLTPSPTTFASTSESLLQKSIKLTPIPPISYWITLAIEYTKRGANREGARCLENGMSKTEDKGGLRMLSILLRQIPDEVNKVIQTDSKIKSSSSSSPPSPPSQASNLSQSLQKAKSAVSLDLNDAESWYILGNAYLTSFFNQTRSPVELTNALKAYNKSEVLYKLDPEYNTNGGCEERGTMVKVNPDLYYNRANLLNHNKNYEEAVKDFKLAGLYDTSLVNAANEEVSKIEIWINRVSDLISKKGRIKAKRLSGIVKDLPAFGSIKDGLVVCRIRDLKLGERDNAGMCLAVKSVMTLSSDNISSQTLLISDAELTCLVLTLGGVKSLGSDIIVVKNPVLKEVSYVNSKGDLKSYREVVNGVEVK